MTLSVAKPSRTWPVYADYFADPFVWRHRDVYYAIGTGAREAKGQTVGRIFPVLQSSDLWNWHYVGGALMPPDEALGNTFWAPAIAFSEGTFYLYYSVGHGDKAHQLRVACSSQPQGPYEDTGEPLLATGAIPFAIDPHPFQDEDGRWYLFFARDFLDCSERVRAGTGLVVHPMRTMTEIDENGQVVLRARSEWQRFRANRPMYGSIWDWHTLEGPCVVRHDQSYYCFYSGGCWENETYGVDYGVADSVMGPYSDAESENGPRVLRTVSDRLVGPGHNSWIVGPDAAEYLVYHAWDLAGNRRQMCLSRLFWTSAGPRCEWFE